jgi:N-methylhydantoinase A/oxoprolinase/acetone carboxylase beta subunit
MPFAAAFSSFGCAAVDISHRYQKSTTVQIPDGADDDWKLMMGQAMLNPGWEELEKLARADFEAEGLPWEQAAVRQIAYVRYGSQMDDIEVPSPVSRINSAEDMGKLIAAFEDLYENVYAGVAKHRQAGYQIFELGLTATIPKVKPKLVKGPLEAADPPPEASKGERDVYSEGKWHKAPIYDMDEIRPGNEIEGIAVIEAPATTFFVPPGRRVAMDEWSMLWLH